MDPNTNPLYDRPIDANRKIKVVCIGAGYSGILSAIRFPQYIDNLDFVVYEKNDDIGGTCNPEWSRFYATGGEIQNYLKDVAWKYDVEKYVRFRHYFQRAEWDEKNQQWRIELKNLDTNKIVVDKADVLLKGTGLLNTWKWPDIPGLHDFKGPYMHSARWDTSFDWTDKRVALIGAGSSGIQILPQIQPKAKKVIHFMKGKTWISPVGYGAEEGGETQEVDIPEEQRKFYRENPKQYQEYRHKIEGAMNKSQLVTFRGTEIQNLFWKMSDESMKEKLKKKPWIYESLRPNYPPGCRRLTPGPGYLEALVEDNVEFIGTGISKVTETGLLDQDGKFHEVDAIIYATGFDYSFNSASTPFVGRGGITLEEAWTPYPEAYLSLCSPKMPNLFFFLGPNGGPGAGSFIAMLEYTVEYIIKCVKKLQREYIASMEVTEEANKAFSEHVDRYFAKTIFTYKVRLFQT
ncbi:FAD-binding monooxygenase tazF [Exophiala dermatitidis]